MKFWKAFFEPFYIFAYVALIFTMVVGPFAFPNDAPWWWYGLWILAVLTICGLHSACKATKKE